MSTILNHHTHHKLKFSDRLRVLYHGTIDVYSGIEINLEDIPLTGNEQVTLKIEKINLL